MIKIDDKYYIKIDKYNYTLCEKHIVTEDEAKKRKNKSAGDIEYKDISFHRDLIQLLSSLFENHKKSIAKNCNLEEYIKELKFMQEDFINKIKNIEVK